MRSFLGMCLNWKVVAVAGVFGAAIWLVAPQFIAAALPLLVVALCPVSMALMAWTMRGDHARPSSATQDPTRHLAALEREQARLAEQIALARSEVAPAVGAPGRTQT